jgi:hypothetical protein
LFSHFPSGFLFVILLSLSFEIEPRNSIVTVGTAGLVSIIELVVDRQDIRYIGMFIMNPADLKKNPVESADP